MAPYINSGDLRFIPTGVGNTSGISEPASPPSVHPHGRGEHCQLFYRVGLLRGSSPRAWGTPTPMSQLIAPERFIPTGVGNTQRVIVRASGPAVHPHGRGEHSIRRHFFDAGFGSSPRAWGTRVRVEPDRAHGRFIPTGVGNTPWPRTRRKVRSVHPHGRGEHSMRPAREGSTGGSSPRAWGTPGSYLPPPHSWRFIPTGVGNTCGNSQIALMPTVHPHGRGEHCGNIYCGCCHYGSSPRAWGTHHPGTV